MSGAEQALATLREYVQRSTQPALGVTQGDALRALQVLEEARCFAFGFEHSDDDGRCPTCGEDGGTSCGAPNCGLLA